jgi:thiol-disulfide isomerase/thioredoxin
MSSKTKQQLKIWLPVALIIMVATVGYMSIYASNPYMEIVGLFKSAMSGSIKDQAAPDFVGIEQWLNTPGGAPISIAELRGKVVLVEFWTFSCINCQRDTPHVVEWYEKYKDQGLVVVGVHTPEFQFERSLESVQKEVNKLGITFPVALDNGYQTWRAYRNHYWPAKYLVDRNGTIVYFRYGEGAYEQTEALIQQLLEELPKG